MTGLTVDDCKFNRYSEIHYLSDFQHKEPLPIPRVLASQLVGANICNVVQYLIPHKGANTDGFDVSGSDVTIQNRCVEFYMFEFKLT